MTGGTYEPAESHGLQKPQSWPTKIELKEVLGMCYGEKPDDRSAQPHGGEEGVNDLLQKEMGPKLGITSQSAAIRSIRGKFGPTRVTYGIASAYNHEHSSSNQK
jgi:hypothetical protein